MDRNEPRLRGTVRRTGGPDVTWSDARLVRRCLSGHEDGWSTLIAKYKNLIYSIPLKYGATPQDASDIFQAVCLELFNELPRLRKPDSLRSWLITVTTHQSFHWKQKFRRRAEDELTEFEVDTLRTDPAADVIAEVEREQQLREAMAELPPRCQEMIRLLFYHQPPLSYKEVAARLGLATGSIGFIRGRCLKRLEHALQKRGI